MYNNKYLGVPIYKKKIKILWYVGAGHLNFECVWKLRAL